MLRSQPSPENSPSLISPPSVKGFPPPAPLAFTPLKTLSETREGFETPAIHQVVVCEDSDWETIDDCEIGSETSEIGSENGFPAIDVDCDDWAEKFTTSIRRFHNSGNYSNHIDVKEAKCPNCDGVFTPHHQCWTLSKTIIFGQNRVWYSCRQSFALLRAIKKMCWISRNGILILYSLVLLN